MNFLFQFRENFHRNGKIMASVHAVCADPGRYEALIDEIAHQGK
jgi:hypothetical protein